MTSGSMIDLIGRIHDEFDRLGWRDSGNTARTLARALIAGQSPAQAAVRASNRFLAQNDITTDSLERVLQQILRQKPRLLIPRPAVGFDGPVSEPPAPRPMSSDTRSQAEEPRSPAPIARKWPTAARVATGAIIVVSSAVVIFFGPDTIHWAWLLSHPSRLGIEWGAFFVAVSLACGVVFSRWGFFGAAVVAGIVAVIALLGH